MRRRRRSRPRDLNKVIEGLERTAAQVKALHEYEARRAQEKKDEDDGRKRSK